MLILLFLQLGFLRSVISSDHLREEDRMALENILATVPQTKSGKNDSTPYSTPQLSPATTPACKKNRLPIGEWNYCGNAQLTCTCCCTQEPAVFGVNKEIVKSILLFLVKQHKGPIHTMCSQAPFTRLF